MTQKKKFIAFTAFVAVALSVFCAFVMKSTKQQTLTVTDADGVTYVAVYGKDGKTYAGVTDKDGNMYAAEIDENGAVLKDRPICVIDYTGTYPFNDTTRTDNINIEQNNADIINANVETKVPEQTTAPTDDTTQSGEVTQESQNTSETRKPEDYMADKFIKLFNSGIFVMTFTTEDSELTEDITLAMRNGSVYMDTSMEGISCKVIFDSNKGTGYVVIPQMRVYCVLPEDLASDMTGADLTMSDISEAVGINVSDVTIDGKDCVCEEFEYENGTTRSFYFYNGNIVKMVIIEDGETTVYNIKSISSNVDNSYFEIPKGYVKVNLSWLQTQN